MLQSAMPYLLLGDYNQKKLKMLRLLMFVFDAFAVILLHFNILYL